jgi:MFS family permease
MDSEKAFPERPPAPFRSQIPVLLLLVAGQIMVSLDFSLSSVALPSIERAFSISAATAQWVLTANALAFGGTLIIGGRLVDLYGQRSCFLLGVLFEAAGSAAAGSGHWILWVIVARVVQGAGAALVYPSVLSLISLSFPPGPARFRALMTSSVGQFLAVPVGAMFAGGLIERFGWRGAFFLIVPIGVMVLLCGLVLLPKRIRATGPAGRIDIPGAIFITTGFSCSVWSLSRITAEGRSTPTSTLLVALIGIVAFGIFLLIQRRSSSPLIPGRMLACHNLPSGLLVTSLTLSALSAMTVLSNIVLQAAGYSPFKAGTALLGFGIGSVLCGIISSRFSRNLLGAPRLVLIFIFLAMCAANIFVASFAHTAFVVVCVPIALLVASLGTVNMTIGTAITLSDVAAADRGVASSLIYTIMQFVVAIALAIMVSVARTRGGVSSAADYIPSFEIAAGLCLAGAFIAATALRPLKEMLLAEELLH